MRSRSVLLFATFLACPFPAFAAFCADVAQQGVTLYFVNRAGLPAATETMLMTQVIDIWRAASVDVRWSPAPSGETPDGGAAAPGVYVMVLPEIPRRLSAPDSSSEGLAVIRFSEGRALRQVYASAGAINRILARDLARPRLGMVPPQVLEQHMARALGRAVAHEVGHYLTNSPAHARRGLMRASHRSSDLVPFRVELPIDESASCVR
jgi:hypothetical protein